MRKKIQLLIVLFLLVALPVALLLSRQRQEIRKKAAGTTNLVLTNTNPEVGAVVYATLALGGEVTEAALVNGSITLPNTVEAMGNLDPLTTGVVFASSSNVSTGTFALKVGAHNKDSMLSGNLFTVHFRPKPGTEGQTITITYSLAGYNLSGSPIASTQTTATLIVAGGTTSTPTPTPTATPAAIPVTGTHAIDPTGADASLCADKGLHCVVFTVNTTGVTSKASVVIHLPNNAAVMCPTDLSAATYTELGCTYTNAFLKDVTVAETHKIPVGNITTAGNYTYTVYASDPAGVRTGNSAGPYPFTINADSAISISNTCFEQGGIVLLTGGNFGATQGSAFLTHTESVASCTTTSCGVSLLPTIWNNSEVKVNIPANTATGNGKVIAIFKSGVNTPIISPAFAVAGNCETTSTATPVPTATPNIPPASGWNSLLVPGATYNAAYDLWPTVKDNRVDGFDYVRWLDLGGQF